MTPESLTHDLTTCLKTVLGFDMTEEPLDKPREDVYNERTEAFTGIPSDNAYTDKPEACVDVLNITNGQCETVTGILHNTEREMLT